MNKDPIKFTLFRRRIIMSNTTVFTGQVMDIEMIPFGLMKVITFNEGFLELYFGVRADFMEVYNGFVIKALLQDFETIPTDDVRKKLSVHGYPIWIKYTHMKFEADKEGVDLLLTCIYNFMKVVTYEAVKYVRDKNREMLIESLKRNIYEYSMINDEADLPNDLVDIYQSQKMIMDMLLNEVEHDEPLDKNLYNIKLHDLFGQCVDKFFKYSGTKYANLLVPFVSLNHLDVEGYKRKLKSRHLEFDELIDRSKKDARKNYKNIEKFTEPKEINEVFKSAQKVLKLLCDDVLLRKTYDEAYIDMMGKIQIVREKYGNKYIDVINAILESIQL